MKAIINHWYPLKSEKKTGYAQNEEITDPSEISEAISSIFMDGFDVMLTHWSNGNMLICVDEKRKRFRQR